MSTNRRRLVPTGLTLIAALALLPGPADAQTVDDMLDQAISRYNSVQLPDALALFDKAILQLEANSTSDAAAKTKLVSALEYRVRARFGVNDAPGATNDLQTLLRYNPDYHLPNEVSIKLDELFQEVRRTTVGDIQLNLSPANTLVEIDGRPAGGRTGPFALPAGMHKLSARRAGYRTVTDMSFEVTAGSAKELTLALERSSATLSLVTSPVGVEVFVDGVSRGITEAGDASRESIENAKSLGVSEISLPKEIADLTVSGHTLEFVRPCYTTDRRTVRIDQFADVTLPPVKLARAVATLDIETAVPGAFVFLDDVRKEAAPTVMGDICEGPRSVEVRSPHARVVKRLDLKAGDRVTVAGELKPAFAIVSVSGGQEGLRGAGDLRLDVERKLADARSFTLYAPPADYAREALRRNGLDDGWLAFDRARQPIGTAGRISPELRTKLSTELPQVLQAQGLAAVTLLPGGGQSNVLLSLLAAGSNVPDVIALQLDEPSSIRAALPLLDVSMPLHRPSLGLLAIDVDHGGGAIVVKVEEGGPAAAAGLVAGDKIVSVDGKRVQDALSLAAALESLGRAARGALEVDHAGVVRKVDAQIVPQPRAMDAGDRTLMLNPLLVQLRYQLASSAGTPDEPVLRLNIAIALMRLGNWEAARTELERTVLPEATGVGDGTVHYYLGNCYDQLSRFADARREWTKAADSQSLLTEDGGSVKEAAALKLAGTSGVR